MVRLSIAAAVPAPPRSHRRGCLCLHLAGSQGLVGRRRNALITAGSPPSAPIGQRHRPVPRPSPAAISHVHARDPGSRCRPRCGPPPFIERKKRQRSDRRRRSRVLLEVPDDLVCVVGRMTSEPIITSCPHAGWLVASDGSAHRPSTRGVRLARDVLARYAQHPRSPWSSPSPRRPACACRAARRLRRCRRGPAQRRPPIRAAPRPSMPSGRRVLVPDDKRRPRSRPPDNRLPFDRRPHGCSRWPQDGSLTIYLQARVTRAQIGVELAPGPGRRLPPRGVSARSARSWTCQGVPAARQ